MNVGSGLVVMGNGGIDHTFIDHSKGAAHISTVNPNAAFKERLTNPKNPKKVGRRDKIS